jgi:hypothetical protein
MNVFCLQETKMVFEKLYKFIGKDIKSMIERPDGRYCLRLHKNKVYYVSEALMKKATNVSSSRYLVATKSMCCSSRWWVARERHVWQWHSAAGYPLMQCSHAAEHKQDSCRQLQGCSSSTAVSHAVPSLVT